MVSHRITLSFKLLLVVVAWAHFPISRVTGFHAPGAPVRRLLQVGQQRSSSASLPALWRRRSFVDSSSSSSSKASIIRRNAHSGSGRGDNHDDDDYGNNNDGEDDVNGATSKLPTRTPNKIVPGTIYFVATPLGNLGDITLRALDILQGVDLIASEDTRTTGLLLKALGLEKKKQLSHHQHNLQGRVPELIHKAKVEKLSIAVVSDAGTPGISDPGNDLAAACWHEGVSLVPVPGACAAIAAVSVAGFLSTEFVFYGFLPSKSGKGRKNKVQEIALQDKPAVLYESPNRVLRTLTEINEAVVALDGSGEREDQREVLCAREITKLHEELFRGTLYDAIGHFKGQGGEEGQERVIRGEFTLVIGPRKKRVLGPEEIEGQVRQMLEQYMKEGLSSSDAVKKVTKIMSGEGGSKLSKSDVYKIALDLKEGR